MAIIGISGIKQSGKNTVAKIINYLIAREDGMDCTFSEALEYWEDGLHGEKQWLYQEKSFASKIKQIVCLLIGCTMEQLEDNSFKEKELGEEWWIYKNGNIIYTIEHYNYYFNKPGYQYVKDAELIKMTPRLLLQLLGTECGRNIIHPNIWVNSLMNDYKDKYEDKDGLIHERYGDQEVSIVPNPIFWKEYYPNWIITDVRFENEIKAIEDRDGIVIRINRPSLKSIDLHESETSLDNHKFLYEIDNDGSIDHLVLLVEMILIQLKIIK